MDVFLELAKSSQFIAVFIGIITVFFKLLADYFQSRAARKLVLKAEKEAYHVLPSEELEGDSSECELSPELLAQRARDIDSLIRQNRDLLQVGRLFDLYSKQIEKYQTETQARAGWSFIFAIFSMLAGLSFVIGGGLPRTHQPRVGACSSSFCNIWNRRRCRSIHNKNISGCSSPFS